MKLRINKTDHARIQQVSAALGIDTNAVVRRCVTFYEKNHPTVATEVMCGSATTVITLSDRSLCGFSADQVRAAVNYTLTLVALSTKGRLPVQIDPRDAATKPVEVNDQGNFVRVIA